MNHDGISCIVPFYNEGQRVGKVVSLLSKVPSITQIVAVDDGSTLPYKLQRSSKLKTIKLKKNYGKTYAVKAGLKHCSTRTILLFDADLSNIDIDQVEAAAQIFINNSIDMLILRKENNPFIIKLTRTDIVISGQRILYKTDLVKALKQQASRYQLELCINDYFMTHHKKTRWYPIKFNFLFKFQKRGFKGLLDEFKMAQQMFNYKGFSFYFKQLIYFCNHSANETTSVRVFNSKSKLLLDRLIITSRRVQIRDWYRN